jgi:hypothetical protein
MQLASNALRTEELPGIDPIVAFAACCDARAYLWSICEYDLHEAVDELQHNAVTAGLVAAIGQDAVQQMMSGAFLKYQAAAHV